MEKHSSYNFKIEQAHWVYTYRIYGDDCFTHDNGEIESREGFYTENEARIAAVFHIDNLENGDRS